MLDNAASAFLPDVAAGANGDVVVAWFREGEGAEDGRYRLFARRYAAGQGWGPVEPVGTDNAVAVGCQVAMDASGNAFVVWMRLGGSSPDHITSVFAARYRAGAGWEPQEEIGTDNAFTVTNPRIAVDRDGNALAVWVENTLSPPTSGLWARRYAAGSGWGAPERIGPEGGGSGEPWVAADGTGSWFAVWAQQEDLGGGLWMTRAWSRRYDSVNGWGSPVPLDNTGAMYVTGPQVAVDNAGNAVATWSRLEPMGSQYHAWSSRYRAGDGWRVAVRVDSDNTTGTGSPSLALDAAGAATAVWTYPGPIGAGSYVRASRSVAGAGWDEWQGIGDNVMVVSPARCGVDAAGNVVAAWSRAGLPETVWANRFVPGAGWTGRVQIDTGAGYQMRDLRLAVSPGGDAFAAWCQTEPPAGAGHIRVARYRASPH